MNRHERRGLSAAKKRKQAKYTNSGIRLDSDPYLQMRSGIPSQDLAVKHRQRAVGIETACESVLSAD